MSENTGWARVEYNSPLGQAFVTGRVEEKIRADSLRRLLAIKDADRILNRLCANGETEYWYITDTLENQLRSARLTVSRSNVQLVEACRSDIMPHYEIEHLGERLDLKGLYKTRELAFRCGVAVYNARIGMAKSMEGDIFTTTILEFYQSRLERFVKENEPRSL